MTSRIPHFRKLFLFLALSLADLALTWWLLHQAGELVYESNPVANWWLHAHGWIGLAAFKIWTVLLVIGLAVVISLQRPRTAGWVLTFACSVSGGVVLYSCLLSGLVRARESGLSQEETAARAIGRRLDRRLSMNRDYGALLGQLSQELIAGRCTWTEAVERLACSEQGTNPVWLKILRARYPGRSDRECLAANLLDTARASLRDDPARVKRLARQMEAELRGTARTPSPGPLSRSLVWQSQSPVGEGKPQQGLTPGVPLATP
jgi:hypothetical protein